MSDPFVAEIRIFPYPFAPRAWAACNGQVLSISQNTALFSILGTTYGGDGRTTFALPNLEGRAPVHEGQGPGLTRRRLGEAFGTDSVTLSEATMPTHNHAVRVTNTQADAASPSGNYLGNAVKEVLGRKGPLKMYDAASASSGQMASQALGTAGGSQSHENRQPFLAIQFCISLYGVFPPRE